MCPGQFIGLIAYVCVSSTGIRNMFSRNFSQWPDVTQRAWSYMSGVFTSE